MKPLAALLDEFRPGLRVLVHAGPSESAALHALLMANPERAAGVTFCGLFIPGLSRFDYAGLHPSARAETLFANPALTRERLDLLPIHYSLWPGHLERCPVDLALLNLPPAQGGVFSCGLAADVAEGVKRYAKRVAVLSNADMPFTPGGAALAAREADAVFEAPSAPMAFPSEAPDEAALTIARQVAALVRDGDCVQVGIGKVPSAILLALSGHRNLTLFGGMIVDEVVALAEAGALAPGRAITTGIGVGTVKLHAFVGAGHAEFRGVSHTHSALEVAKRANFISLNSAIEVDLFGAINCESVKGRAVSGVGGGVDYMRAARLSAGGRSVIALQAEAKGLSRIVQRLPAGATSIARAEIDTLVTEYGVAQLRDLSVEARAQAIIAIAAPDHRAALAEGWASVRSGG